MVHKKPDSAVLETGDSARETGTALVALHFISPGAPLLGLTLEGLIYEIEIKDNALIRHPHPCDAWHADPKQFSRDQWTAVIHAAICWPKAGKPLAWRLFKAQINRFGFFQNWDICTWEWVWYFRALNLWLLYPLVVLLDLGLVVNAVIRALVSYTDPYNVGDDINLTTGILVATKVKFWTPTAWLAKQILRLRNLTLLWSWQYYYRHLEDPPMDELMKPIIREVFG